MSADRRSQQSAETVTAIEHNGHLGQDRCSEDPSIVWSELIFEFRQTKHMFLAHTTEDSIAGKAQLTWANGSIKKFASLQLSPAAAVLNYAQAAFEGMKALRTPDGEIVLFRPEENARRFRRSAAALGMPPYPAAGFLQAVEDLVRREAAFVPPYHVVGWPSDCPPGSRSLYIRPVMLGNGPVLGVKPAHSYLFYIFVSPVGVYRSGGALSVLDSAHRAPTYGLGSVKAAANYPATIQPLSVATQQDGYVDVLYLDARHDRFVEEVGSSNFFAVLKDGTLVTPRLGSILPGITRDSIITIGRELLNWRVVERDISLEEVFDDAEEVFFTGTAAAIVPVTKISYRGRVVSFAAAKTKETQAKLLKDILIAIQTKQVPDPFNWVRVVGKK